MKKLTRIEKINKIIEEKQFAKIDRVTIDVTTACLLKTIYDKFKKDSSKLKFEKLPIKKLVTICWEILP